MIRNAQAKYRAIRFPIRFMRMLFQTMDFMDFAITQKLKLGQSQLLQGVHWDMPPIEVSLL